MTFFNKKNTYIKIILLLFSLTVLDNLVLILFGTQTEGIVIQYVNNYLGGEKQPTIKYPIIEFTDNNKTHKFNGNWDAKYHSGDVVPVIYKPWRPGRARIKTFWGIAKKPSIQFIIALLIWSMFYSSFKSKM